MGINFGRIAQGLATGYLGAAIKDKESKDNARLEVVKAAGIDYYTNQLPAHKKSEENRAQAYKELTKIFGSEEAADYYDANFSRGDGKDVERALKMLEDKNIKPGAFKDYIPTSNYSERYKTRQTDFETRFEPVAKTLTMQQGGLGKSTVDGLLTKPEGDITTTEQVTTPAVPEKQIEGTPLMTRAIPETTKEVTTEIPRTTADSPISAFYAAKPDERGVETKFENIKKNVVESYGYGESYTTQDGRLEFRLSGAKRNEANAHVALAENFSKNRPDINQIEAATLAKQELDRQVLTPYKIIESSLKDMKYLPGDGQTGKAVLGNISKNIDAASTMVNGVSIYEFITDIYNNDLLQDGSGNVNKAVFDKFVENLPVNIMYEGDSLKNVLQNAHAMQYFNRYN
jgi:hypothetical protein